MRAIPRWQIALLFVPVVGWLLAAALVLDAGGEASPGPPEECATVPAPTGRRLAAAALDGIPLVALALLLPPALAWLVGAAYWVFRDAGPRPIGPGKRLLGLRVCGRAAPLAYADGLGRNLPLLVPYLGVAVETALVLSGRRRLGDRLVGTAVVSPPRAR